MECRHSHRLYGTMTALFFIVWNADEGISGTQVKHRVQFQQMIEDAKAKKIDLILTKSISRFARNVVDCLTNIRLLRNLRPPAVS